AVAIAVIAVAATRIAAVAA
ncbi:hypothetical protein A2U01_0074576, partial [Trifolium medium]|nr:hypothetical protein [Trifolium medium]